MTIIENENVFSRCSLRVVAIIAQQVTLCELFELILDRLPRSETEVRQQPLNPQLFFLVLVFFFQDAREESDGDSCGRSL